MSTPSPAVLAKLTPVLTKRWTAPDAWRRETYEQLDGYRLCVRRSRPIRTT